MRDKEYVTCAICRKRFVGYVPKGGDGSVLFPRKHNLMSQRAWQAKIGYVAIVPYCKGAFRPALEYQKPSPETE